MNNGISVEEACQNRYLSGEDYERLCTDSGMPKFSPTTTTAVSIKDAPQTEVTVDNTVLVVGLAVIIVLTVAVALMAWRLLRRTQDRG